MTALRRVSTRGYLHLGDFVDRDGILRRIPVAITTDEHVVEVDLAGVRDFTGSAGVVLGRCLPSARISVRGGTVSQRQELRELIELGQRQVGAA
jgi:hypothetical protein